MDPNLRRSYDTDLLILRSLFALDPNTNLPISTNYIMASDGLADIIWQNPYTNLSNTDSTVGYLPSTIRYLISSSLQTSTLWYTVPEGLSSLSTTIGFASNSFQGTGIFTSNITSTVQGLGSSRYVSSLSLLSSIQGLGSAGYISTSQLVSTTGWFLDPSRYVSTGALVSTTAAFITNPAFVSTVEGLGSAGYISTATLTSTINNALASTVKGLGTVGYISTSQLVSTTAWFLDPSRYVSTGALVSTAAGLSTNLQTSFYINSAGTVVINGGTVVFSSVSNVVYLSTFVFSSLTYKGNMGTIIANSNLNQLGGSNYNLLFSTATISFDNFSSYITTKSRIYLDIYPTFVFSELNTGASGYQLFPMSTFLGYGTTSNLPYQNTSYLFLQNKVAGYGNIFNSAMKIQIPGCNIINNYTSNYQLYHYLPWSYSVNLNAGLNTNTVYTQYGSTNSIFLTIQNLQ